MDLGKGRNAIHFILTMEVARFSEMLESYRSITRRYTPEDLNLNLSEWSVELSKCTPVSYKHKLFALLYVN
jgi:hypothetical protein